MLRFFVIFTHFFARVSPASETKIGSYPVLGRHEFKMSCSKHEAKNFTLVAQKPKSCAGSVYIKNLTLTYTSGLKQKLNYTRSLSTCHGIPLTRTSVHLLPGTKCLSDFSAELSVNGETDPKCMKYHRIDLLLTRDQTKAHKI